MTDTSQPLIVILETPLTRGDMTIAQLEIRDIFGRDCAGLSLAKMSVSNYDEFRALLPRVCDLLEHEIDLLASDDLVDIITDMGELAQIDDDGVEGIMLRKPLGGDLRNVSVARLQHLYYEELRAVVPRISTPRLSEEAIDELPLAKLMGLAAKVSDFLLSARRRAEFRIE
ncbi:phage tail assembly protein [Sphingomonas sp. UV9]|uniref:phage tail assembly protein n=1 Tax=Sphingomonas sp. UV9 TaxID=1851410 RepID=UPI000FFBD254|nr:phage tail assembly protein [Sphingomonas sp. UV9]RXD05556.1 phage tail assembly protein [Sphingomonas sp. UV9]